MPSSHLLNMAGEFRICRNIQIATFVVLLVSMTVGGIFFGLYGMLFSLLLVTLLLDVLEMGYVHTRFFKGKLAALLKLLLPLVVTGAAACAVEFSLISTLSGYFQFILCGILFAAVNGILAVVVGLVFNRKIFLALFSRVKGLIKRH